MIRLAARIRERGIAPITTAGFLNYSRPSFADAIARCVAKGATTIIVVPYFLVSGYFVTVTLAQMVEQARQQYSTVTFLQTSAFNDHPAMARVIRKRAAEVSPSLWRESGLLVMLHGSPRPTSNVPIERLVQQIADTHEFARVCVCFMELNEPRIDQAIDDFVADCITRLIAVPYFLQAGSHTLEDIPTILRAAQAKYPHAAIHRTDYLGYDTLIADVITERVAEAQLSK